MLSCPYAADQATECKVVVDYPAEHPKSGDLMEGTGGVRVIYYYHDERIPLYLLTLFGKMSELIYQRQIGMRFLN